MKKCLIDIFHRKKNKMWKFVGSNGQEDEMDDWYPEQDWREEMEA